MSIMTCLAVHDFVSLVRYISFIYCYICFFALYDFVHYFLFIIIISYMSRHYLLCSVLRMTFDPFCVHSFKLNMSSFISHEFLFHSLRQQFNFSLICKLTLKLYFNIIILDTSY